MNCPECGRPVSARHNQCDACGCDLTLYRKLVMLSAQYYNQGLEKAKVRDLTGAVVLLKNSLEINKRNTDARNLLGLVYFEMGETVAALSEWVISKHFQPEDNFADSYMDTVQANSVQLDAINQAIRKYNTALEAAKSGTDDIAILQLKKVIGLHPNFIRAAQLLALLYIKSNDIERAKRLLIRISRIDISNTTTLQYLTEINKIQSGEAAENGNTENEAEYSGLQPGIAPVDSFKEEHVNVWPFVNLVLGTIVGILVLFFIIVPAKEKEYRETYQADVISYSEELNTKIAAIDSLTTQVNALQSKNDVLEHDLQEAIGRVEYVSYEDPKYAQLFVDLYNAMTQYNVYVADTQARQEKKEDPSQQLCRKTAAVLLAVNIDDTENEEAHAIYDEMCSYVMADASGYCYQLGAAEYDKGQYENAITYFLEANDYDNTYDRPMYYLGLCYTRIGNNEKAILYYEMLITVCPNSSLIGSATENLNQLR